MQKTLSIISFSLFAMIFYFGEFSGSQTPLEQLTQPTEHNILLDLSSESDKVIYDNLIFSNYSCTMINPKQAVCSQFQPQGDVIASDGSVELYQYKTNDGQKEFKIFQLANGEAHIEFKLDSSEKLYRYSFTSLEQISLFTDQKGLFTTESVEWDISSLDYVL